MDAEVTLSQIRVLGRELASQLPALAAAHDQIRDIQRRLIDCARMLGEDHPEQQALLGHLLDLDRCHTSPVGLKIISAHLQQAGKPLNAEALNAFRTDLAGALQLMRN